MNRSNENFINPITGSPFPNEDIGFGDEAFNVLGQNLDFGEFHETTADVHPNSMLNASCGNLSKK